MCRTYVKGLTSTEEDHGILAARVLSEHVADILLACGVRVQQRQELLDEVACSFSEALHEISRLAFQFQRIAGECIVSSDLCPVVVENGTDFDPNRMTNEWADPRRSRRSVETTPVLCTTQLGLVRETVRSKTGVEGGDEQWQATVTILLKPRVVLTTMLDELRNEQAPIELCDESGTDTVLSFNVLLLTNIDIDANHANTTLDTDLMDC